MGIWAAVRGHGIWALVVVTTAFGLYNASQRPENQVTAAVSNTMLIAAATAVVLIFYLRPKP
jgi:hypothetical protein